MAQSFKQLIAWRKAMELVIEIYRVTRNFPRDEVYGLTSQLRRAEFLFLAILPRGKHDIHAVSFIDS